MNQHPIPSHEAIQLSGSPAAPCIVIAPAPSVDPDDVADFCRQLENTFHIRITELECGADRFQLLFALEHQHYRMYYEQLSESMWIESSTGDPREGIQKLYEQLLLHC